MTTLPGGTAAGEGTGGRPPPAVHVRGLVKCYADVTAVNGIDLDIRRGEIFALLGPNGAGKTTTVEILEGYRSRDSGEVTVLGWDPARQRAQLKSQIGSVLQPTGVERYLTVAETVRMYAGFYPHPRPVDEVIGLAGLEAKRNSRVNKLSGGQQRRLLLTTHYMDEAQFLADRVAVISAGQIVADGDPATLVNRSDVLVVAIWGLAGLLLAIRFLSWEPRSG